MACKVLLTAWQFRSMFSLAVCLVSWVSDLVTVGYRLILRMLVMLLGWKFGLVVQLRRNSRWARLIPRPGRMRIRNLLTWMVLIPFEGASC